MICGICRKNTRLTAKEKYSEYTLQECSDCSGQFWTPMKNPGAEWYEKDIRYSFRNRSPLKKPESNHREFFKDRPLAGGKILDVGMGTGNFLAAAADLGYQTYGIDFDKDAIQTAKTVFGLENVYQISIEETIAKFGRQYFDALTMFEVLEHVEDPSGTIEKNKMLLRPGGYLALSVPYRDASKLFTAHDVPPRHLSRWNEKSIKNLLEACGFSVIRLKIIPVSIPYLITKYHFWYKNLFSFNAVERLTAAANKSSDQNQNRQLTLKIKLLQSVARLKDYFLFIVPSLLLYLRLYKNNRLGLTLYVLARKSVKY